MKSEIYWSALYSSKAYDISYKQKSKINQLTHYAIKIHFTTSMLNVRRAFRRIANCEIFQCNILIYISLKVDFTALCLLWIGMS